MSGAKRSKLQLAAAAAAATKDREEDTTARLSGAGDGKDTGGEKPIRTTIDLSPMDHRAFAKWVGEAKTELGARKLPNAVVWRVLVDLLTRNPGVAELVMEKLRAEVED